MLHLHLPIALLLAAATTIGCTSTRRAPAGPIEGANPGECSDGADNDSDGFFDCDDTNCDAYFDSYAYADRDSNSNSNSYTHGVLREKAGG